jgi:hypothetical protein
MPSVQHLLNGDLEALREAVRGVSAEEAPSSWVLNQIVLGSALRLRSSHAADAERARMYAEAIDAFEAALTVSRQQTSRDRLPGVPSLTLQNGSHFVGPDGVQLVVDATAVPASEGTELLERAVRVFRDAGHRANRRTDMRVWIAAMSNLGCTLTLLGRRTQGVAGVSILEEAVDVLQEALRAPSLQRAAEERASTQINLAEAFQALAERGMPSESLRYLEQAADWLAAALGYHAPPEYRWVLQLERSQLA